MSISLRQFTRDDFPRLIAWVDESGADFFAQWAGTAFQFPLDEAQLEAHLAEAEGPEATRRIFAAVEQTSGEVVGHVELGHLNRTQRTATISRLLVGEP